MYLLLAMVFVGFDTFAADEMLICNASLSSSQDKRYQFRDYDLKVLLFVPEIKEELDLLPLSGYGEHALLSMENCLAMRAIKASAVIQEKLKKEVISVFSDLSDIEKQHYSYKILTRNALIRMPNIDVCFVFKGTEYKRRINLHQELFGENGTPSSFKDLSKQIEQFFVEARLQSLKVY